MFEEVLTRIQFLLPANPEGHCLQVGAIGVLSSLSSDHAVIWQQLAFKQYCSFKWSLLQKNKAMFWLDNCFSNFYFHFYENSFNAKLSEI